MTGDKRPGRKTDDQTGEVFDTTQLKPSAQEKRVARDYAAHYFRWGWVQRCLGRMPDGVRLLDVGCGQELPMLGVIQSDHSAAAKIFNGGRYVGVDMNKTIRQPPSKWVTIHPAFNICERGHELGEFDLVTCFEVIEHMEVHSGDRLLQAIRDRLAPIQGFAMLSTPCYNGDETNRDRRQAKNHIHEYTVPELAASFERNGLKVVQRWGTFASYVDVKRGLKELGFDPAVDHLFEKVREYYGDDVTGNWLAPLLPDHSRNNMWKVVRA